MMMSELNTVTILPLILEEIWQTILPWKSSMDQCPSKNHLIQKMAGLHLSLRVTSTRFISEWLDSITRSLPLLHLKDGKIGISQFILFTIGPMSDRLLISKLASMVGLMVGLRKMILLMLIQITGFSANMLSIMKQRLVKHTSSSTVRTNLATHTRNKRSIKRVIDALAIAMRILTKKIHLRIE